jgi:hypothetical protein
MSARLDQCWLTSGRWYLNCDSCLIYERVQKGNHIVRTVYQSSLILNLERIWSWSITDGRPDGLLRCQDGGKLEQKLLDTMKGPDGKIRCPDRWCLSIWRPDRMTRRPDGLSSGQINVRMGWHVVRTANRESEIFYLFRSAESSENALKSGIPVYNIFTHKWFFPSRMRPKY